MRLKVVVADDEQLICGMLCRLIHTEELQVDIVGKAFDGEELFNLIKNLQPDIVVTDISMPNMDGIEVIKQTAQIGLRTKFIVVSGYKQFEYAYTALKYDVVDYLLKPVDEAELNGAISKIAWHIRHNSDGILNSVGNPAKSFFVHEGVKEIKANPISIKEVNINYGTNFEMGCFQVILLRIEYSKKPEQTPINANSVHKKISSLMMQILSKHCYEMIIANDMDDLIAILNFNETNKNIMPGLFSELLAESKNALSVFEGLFATLCIGSVHKEVFELDQSKDEAILAAWVRMAYGTGRVIYYDKLEMDQTEGKARKLACIEKNISTAFESLDQELFTESINQIFAMPREGICSIEVRALLKRLPDIFFELHKEKIGTVDNYDRVYKDIRYAMRVVTTFYDLKYTIIRMFNSLMEEIDGTINSQYTKHIRLVMEYIRMNYSKPISLEEVADEVGLSSVYLSTIFKKEVDQNFSDYLKEYRLNIAKKMLVDSNLSISEIANNLSFEDARYFSKVFKKSIGIKPTEYRKIYS